MCCAKNLNGNPRYGSSALTDHGRASCGPTLPWNSGEAAGGRWRLAAAQPFPHAPDKGAPAKFSSVATCEMGLSGWSAGWHTVDSRALKSSSSWLDGMTNASSSSVMVPSRPAGRRGESRNRVCSRGDLLRRPSRLFSRLASRRILRAAFGPVAFDRPTVTGVNSRTGRLIVNQMDAGLARAGTKGFLLDPAPHSGRQIRDGPHLVVMRFARARTSAPLRRWPTGLDARGAQNGSPEPARAWRVMNPARQSGPMRAPVREVA